MTSLILTPNDGPGPLDLLNPDAINLMRDGSIDSILPVPVFESTYADSPDTEGALRTRRRPTNPSGEGQVMIAGATAAQFQINLSVWQEVVDAVGKYGGTLAYQPDFGSYQAMVTGMGPSLYWTLDQTTGVTDQSGFGRNGAGQGGVTIGGYSPGPVAGNAATDLDDIDDKITSSYAAYLQGSTRTFTGWFYRDTNSGQDGIFSSTSGSGHNFLLRAETNNGVSLYADTTSDGGMFWNPVLSLGSWFHLALVYVDVQGDAAGAGTSRAKLYVNGVDVGPAISGGFSDLDGAPGTFQVGAWGGGQFFDGKTAHVAVWERALSAVEIQNLYRQAPSPITYDLTEMAITSMPQDAAMTALNRGVSGFSFTCKPYGRLDQSIVVSNQTSTTPLLTFDVPALVGSADALGILTLQDTASQARSHLEGGLESRYYSASNPWPLLVTRDTIQGLDSAVSDTQAGSYGTTTWRQTLSTTSKGVGYFTGSHVGRFRVKARLNQTDNAGVRVYARLGYAIRGGGTRFLDWQPLPTTSVGWSEVDLGIANIDPAITGTHSVTFSLYAKAASSTPTVQFDYFKILPAERYFLAHGSVGSVATVRSGRYAQIRYESILTETSDGVWTQHPSPTGSNLRIPVQGGRIAVALNRNDLENALHSTLGDPMRADLTVIPRVTLLGT